MQALATGKDTLLRGEYRLLEVIGDGESRVYLARREGSSHDSTTSSTLVVARLWKPSAELLREHGAQALFERAAAQMRSAALLRHPVLAMVDTSGALEDGTLFIISERVEGKPLDVFINSSGIPPLPSVIDLAYRICSGLNTAHRNGLAHAALHPGSVIVRPNADTGAIARLHAKLIDFGTPTCMFGTPPALNAARFMAPEQLELALKPAIERGEPTVRMNVYGCGALLYAMCTGGPPLPGKSIDELLVAHAAHKVVPPSRINPQVLPALDAIILKALDPQPRARFANAAELANALISIRFERSSSGVRPRAEGGFEERLTSRASKLPEPPASADADFVAFPSERPTAEIHVQLPSIPPLSRLSPPPPSLPPTLPSVPSASHVTPPPEPEPLALDSLDDDEDITAEAPLPEIPPAERISKPEPPAVLARPARRSMVPASDLLSRVPPVAFIALAALISLSVIFAVITQPADAPAIEVTPLPVPPIKSHVQEPPPAQPPSTESEESAGATALRDDEPERAEDTPRTNRSRRPAPPKPNIEPRSLPDPEEPSTARPIANADPLPLPELAPAPEPDSSPAEPQQRSKDSTVAPASAPTPPAGPELSPPKRSAIAPLPEQPSKPIVPLPEKSTARFYDVAVKGSLATSQVRRGIERLQAGTQACYRAVLATRPSSIGEVSVEVVVDERGRARSARATGAIPGSLKSCLEGTARKLSVPPPDTGTVTATWKVSL